MEVIHVAETEAAADDCALLLSALGIPHEIERGEIGWRVVVPMEHAPRARQALLDERDQSLHPAEFAEYGPTWVGAVAVALLTTFFAFVERHPSWVGRGAADAERILSGQPWRIVTALTLHADLAHLIGNAAGLLVLLSALGRWIGPGPASWLVLASGAIGNLATAVVHGGGHVSIGASTSIFGALGLLAALQRARHEPKRAFLVVAASLALLAMLGISAHADVLAHLFGLTAGALLAPIAAPLVRKPPARSVWQTILALTALFAVAAAWRLALG